MKECLKMALVALILSVMPCQQASASKPANCWCLYGQYNPGVLLPESGSNETFNAFSVGANTELKLSNSIPLYFGTGIGFQFSFLNESESGLLYTTAGTFKAKAEADIFLMSIKVPLNLSYSIDLPDAPVSIIPVAGFDLRFNTIGNAKIKAVVNGVSVSKTVSIFNSDEMGGSSNTANRFQVGAHFGVNFKLWQKFLIGYSYQLDFNEIAPNLHVNQHNITLGYCF